MKSELALLTDQFRQVYEKDPWYGTSVKAILDSLSPAVVFDPPAPNVHSIAELVAHVMSWRRFLQNRLTSDSVYIPAQEETFDWRKIANNQANAWEELREQLDLNQQQLLELLEQKDDSLLDQSVAAKPYTFRYLIHGVLHHDIYHLGQISLINRMYQEQDKAGNKQTRPFSLFNIFKSFREKTSSHHVFSYEELSLLK